MNLFSVPQGLILKYEEGGNSNQFEIAFLSFLL